MGPQGTGSGPRLLVAIVHRSVEARHAMAELGRLVAELEMIYLGQSLLTSNVNGEACLCNICKAV